MCLGDLSGSMRGNMIGVGVIGGRVIAQACRLDPRLETLSQARRKRAIETISLECISYGFGKRDSRAEGGVTECAPFSLVKAPQPIRAVTA